MPTLSRDTSPEVERMLIELLREKEPAERIRMGASATESLRRLVRAHLTHQYPNASEDELRGRFAARWLGREWAIRVCGWDPEKNGW